jgi:hypothetical protein
MIAHDPLHRSGQAELPHPAPTLGEDAQAHERQKFVHDVVLLIVRPFAQ